MGRYRQIGWVRRPGRGRPGRRAGRPRRGRSGRTGPATASACCRAASASGCCSPGPWPRRPRLLLLDEPFTGVDATTTDSLLAVLHRLRADGVAVVMSTHDLSVAHLACDEACLLNHHQVAFGPIERGADAPSSSSADLRRRRPCCSTAAPRSSPADGRVAPAGRAVRRRLHAAGARRGRAAGRARRRGRRARAAAAARRSSPRSCSTPCSPASPSPSRSGSRCSSARSLAGVVSVVLFTLGDPPPAHRPRRGDGAC